jgi:predicted DsbA family dithiol-disulfide isomerase
VRIEKLKQNYHVKINIVPYPLNPDIKPAGMTLEEIFEDRDIDIPAMKARMKKLMDEEGLPYGDREMVYNSRLAQELTRWADSVDSAKAKKLHESLFVKYFVDKQDINSIDVLVKTATEAALDAVEARKVLTERTFKDKVSADWQQARLLGLTGVPAFVIDRQGVVGAQPYEVLEQLIVAAGAVRKTAP